MIKWLKRLTAGARNAPAPIVGNPDATVIINRVLLTKTQARALCAALQGVNPGAEHEPSAREIAALMHSGMGTGAGKERSR